MKVSIPLTCFVLCAASSHVSAQPTLKESFQNYFLIGAALNESQFSERNAAEAELVKRQFNAISPENVMKWEAIHPTPDTYHFGPADQYVAFGEQNKMFIVGHTLIWHSQTPRWVFQDDKGQPADRAILLERMSGHIHSVVGRYKGHVKGWDVVNEALADDGTLRETPWMKIIGDDYIEKAFEYARDADPDAELYYNDYSLEDPAKRAGAVALVKRLQAAGIKISGIGTQMHVKLDRPSAQLVDDTLGAFGELGIKVNITELDVDMLPAAIKENGAGVELNAAPSPALNPYPDGLPPSAQQALTDRYASLFALFVKHRSAIGRVTFWGVTDADSWLNNWPVRGRRNYPLLFDREGNPKPAYASVIETATQANPSAL